MLVRKIFQKLCILSWRLVACHKLTRFPTRTKHQTCDNKLPHISGWEGCGRYFETATRQFERLENSISLGNKRNGVGNYRSPLKRGSTEGHYPKYKRHEVCTQISRYKEYLIRGFCYLYDDRSAPRIVCLQIRYLQIRVQMCQAPPHSESNADTYSGLCAQRCTHFGEGLEVGDLWCLGQHSAEFRAETPEHPS